MTETMLLDPAHDPRLLPRSRPWVVGYDANLRPDPSSILTGLDEFERLVAIGAVPGLLLSDRERRVGIGRSGTSRWRDLVAPLWSRSVAYARMSNHSTMFAWMVGDVGWNLNMNMPTGTSRPSFSGALKELGARMALARSIVEALVDPKEAERLKEVTHSRARIMTAAASQTEAERPATWHQDRRILSGVGGCDWLPDGSLTLSAQGRGALDRLPSVLHVEHRRGMNPLKTRQTEVISMYAPISLCLNPGSAMDRLRSLCIIPEGQTWYAS